MSQPEKERRAEIRKPATGAVTLSFAGPLPFTFSGRLLDTSAGGFRAAHECAAIRTGMDVDFAHAAASGRARVAWNRITGNAIETGFMLCGTPAPERRAPEARTKRARARPLRNAGGTRKPGGAGRRQ
ncbi:MAG: hypothetical protein ABSB67_11190 [Bryobacteraceae bacterium]|jgi:hypothetical protein